MIKYLGSKRLLIPDIMGIVKALPEVRRVADLFSGTSRVGYALKREGFKVLANDSSEYAATIARCYVQADRERHYAQAERTITELNRLRPQGGYITQVFCQEARFFQPKNGERIDAIREWIEREVNEAELKSILITALLEAADRVDSTCGVHMAYLRKWAARSHNDLLLRVPDLLPRAARGRGLAVCGDAADTARAYEVDLAYLDPPYNQHKYLSNYHIWETITKWDKPDHYGVARKRVDCRTRPSAWNSKSGIAGAFADLVAGLRAKHAVVSFSDEGFLSAEQILETLRHKYAVVKKFAKSHPRYVGSKIGVHDNRGNLVGTPTHHTCKEFLFVASNEEVPSHDLRHLNRSA